MDHSNALISSVASCRDMRFSAIALLIAFSLISCEKENPPLQEEEEVQQALEPELPATPFPYSTQAFPEEWLTDPALQLFGNIGSGIEVTDAGRGELSSSYDVFIKLAQVLSPMVWSFLFNAFGAEQNTPFLSHLYHDHFTKTGSGQT